MHASLRHLVCLLICVFALVGCQSEKEDAQGGTKTVRGQAIKGVISNGIVSAYSVSESQALELITTSATNSLGEFALQIPESAFSQPVLLQITSNAETTTMKCDQASGCTSSKDGHWFEFGELVPLASDFQLLGLAQTTSSGYLANISALSHLVVATALNLPDGLTYANIEQANNWVADTLNLQASPLSTQFIDITDNSEVEDSDANKLIMSLLGASLFELAHTQSWYDASITINDISPSQVYSKSAAIAQRLSVTLNNDVQTQVDALTVRASSLTGDSDFQILSSPESRSATQGESFYFRVHAVSNTPIAYQWLHNGSEIPSATSPVYGKASSKLSDAGSYQVRISSNGQTVFSSLATLQVNTAAVALDVIKQPQGVSLVQGQTLSLNVATNIDEEVEIRWQKNGSLLTSQLGSNLMISDVDESDSGAYRAIAFRNGQIAYSNFAHVQVTNGLSGIHITQHPTSITILEGQQANIQVSASGGGFLRYQWFRNGTELLNATRSYLSISNASAEDEGSYFVQVSNSAGKVSSSHAEVQVISANASLNLLEHPRSASIYIGATHTLGVKTSAPTSHQYQWYKNGNAIPGANSEYFTISNAQTSESGAYHVVATSALGTLISNSANITVREPPSLALSWAMPSERENGEPLSPSEIYGYRLAYGYQENSIDQGITVVGASNTQFTLTNLNAGRIYLHIATIDSDGVTGRFSSPIEVYLP